MTLSEMQKDASLKAETQKLAVVFSLDRHYLDPFTVALGSLLMTNDAAKLAIYIFYDAEDERSIFVNRVNELYDKLNICENKPIFTAIKKEDYAQYDSSLTGSHMTYGKVSAMKHAEEDYILCIDCDCLITGNLFSIISQGDGESPCAAVTDRRSPTHDMEGYKINGIAPESGLDYFNAGVILFCRENCDFESTLDRFNGTADSITGARYDDQTYLNVVFKGEWQSLEPKWNAQTSVGRTLVFHENELCRILHFVGRQKPWRSPAVNIANYLWLTFALHLDVALGKNFQSSLKKEYRLSRIQKAIRLFEIKLTFYRLIHKEYRRSAGIIKDALDLTAKSEELNLWIKSLRMNAPKNPLRLF